MSFDTMAGLLVFCSDFHEGQDSRLYRILSRLTGPHYRMHLSDNAWKAIRRGRDDLADEWQEARVVYRALKRKYGNKPKPE